jgi:hypothetical protein
MLMANFPRAANRVHPVETSTQVPPGVKTPFLRNTHSPGG